MDNSEEALRWFSKVITFPGTPQRVKDLARDQRELIRQTEEGLKNETVNEIDNLTVEKKHGFFGKFFKWQYKDGPLPYIAF